MLTGGVIRAVRHRNASTQAADIALARAAARRRWRRTRLDREQRDPTAAQQPQTKWQKRAHALRSHPFVVVMETAGLVGLVFAVGLFVYELRERQDERIARAWSLLTTPAPGNSGKREALEYLNREYGCLPFGWQISAVGKCWKQHTPLTGVDLSIATHRGRVHLNRIELPQATLQGANFRGAGLRQAVFSAANLGAADLSRTTLQNADLSRANLTLANLSESRLVLADLSNAFLTSANLTDTVLWGVNLSGAYLWRANLSGADFGPTEFTFTHLRDGQLEDIAVTQGAILDANTYLRDIWAWADRRPKNMPPEIAAAITYRDPAERPAEPSR